MSIDIEYQKWISGYGDGDGHGYGYGYGYGYGDGYGHGYGDGYAAAMGVVGENIILYLRPWPYLKIGCEMHTIEYWRKNWQQIAQKHEIEITQTEVDKILEKIK